MDDGPGVSKLLLENELHTAYQMVGQYEGSHSSVPADLQEHVLDLEARLAEFNPPVDSERVG